MSLPQWPQKANQLRHVRGVRNRLENELRKLQKLAMATGTRTDGRSAFQVLSEVEAYFENQQSSSPTWTVQDE
jgi:hypothetical protein